MEALRLAFPAPARGIPGLRMLGVCLKHHALIPRPRPPRIIVSMPNRAVSGGDLSRRNVWCPSFHAGEGGIQTFHRPQYGATPSVAHFQKSPVRVRRGTRQGEQGGLLTSGCRKSVEPSCILHHSCTTKSSGNPLTDDEWVSDGARELDPHRLGFSVGVK